MGLTYRCQSLNEKDQAPWFTQLNLDVKYRIAAGLGKKIVQQHQEEFVQRAWEVVEQVNDQNQQTRQNVLSERVRESIVNKRIDSAGYWGIHNINKKEGSEGAKMTFASPAAMSLINQKIASGQNSVENFLKSISDENIINAIKHEVVDLPTKDDILKISDKEIFNIFESCKGVLSPFWSKSSKWEEKPDTIFLHHLVGIDSSNVDRSYIFEDYLKTLRFKFNDELIKLIIDLQATKSTWKSDEKIFNHKYSVVTGTSCNVMNKILGNDTTSTDLKLFSMNSLRGYKDGNDSTTISGYNPTYDRNGENVLYSTIFGVSTFFA